MIITSRFFNRSELIGFVALAVVLFVILPLSLRPYRDAFVYGVVLFILTLRPQGLVVLRSSLQRV
mgnify:CR=1 FL=1